jgi:hypothetical protein
MTPQSSSSSKKSAAPPLRSGRVALSVIVLALELVLVLDFVQQQEHFWPARRVSEGSSLCRAWRAMTGKGWSLRLRLSAFGRQRSEFERSYSQSGAAHARKPKKAFVPGSMNNFGPTIRTIEAPYPYSLNRRDFLPSALCTMINSPTFSVVNSPTS